MSSCNRQWYYARSRGAKKPWRSQYSAIWRDWVANRNRTTRNGVRNCSSKTGSRRKSPAPKWRKSADKSLSQPWCSHSNTISDVQLQKDNSITHAAAAPSNLDATSTMRSGTSRGYITRMSLHTWQQNMITFIQGDLQWRIPQPPRTTHARRHAKCRTPRENQKNIKTRMPTTASHTRASFKNWKLKMWNRSFRARLPRKSESGRCESEAFVRDFPQNLKVADEAFVRDFRQNLTVEDVKTKLSCETSLKNWKRKMWKRSFRARLFRQITKAS